MNAINNIFLAEDDLDDSYLFQEALKEVNKFALLTVADNGEELTSKLQTSSHAPQLIFLDLNMPIKNGFDCLDEIRSSRVYGNTPVVVLSTSGSDYSVNTSYQKGADLYIQKPDNYKDLKKAIDLCLARDWNNCQRPPENSNFFIRIHN